MLRKKKLQKLLAVVLPLLRSWSDRCNITFPHVFLQWLSKQCSSWFFLFTFITKKKGWNGIFISCRSINKMNGTDSITWSWLPRSFLSNGSCHTAFIHVSLSCLHLMGPGKVLKWNSGLHSRQSPFLLPSASRLCSVQVSFLHLLIL